MYYPELDALCHEVAGKLSELRRLTMESPVLTEEQESLLAELTRLLRLADATASQQIHSLLGDTAVPDTAFLAELREEYPLLTAPAPLVAAGHAPKELATPNLPPETVIEDTEGEPVERTTAQGDYPLRWPLTGHAVEQQFVHCDINGAWWLVDGGAALRFASRRELDGYLAQNGFGPRASDPLAWPPKADSDVPEETLVPDGMLELIYWDIQPIVPGDPSRLLARDAEGSWCLILARADGPHALTFASEEARMNYLIVEGH